MSASSSGVLVYGTAPPFNPQLAWRDRTGRSLPLATFDKATEPILSPDGRTLAATRNLPQTGIDVWLFEFTRETVTRFTTNRRGQVPLTVVVNWTGLLPR